MAAWCVFLFIYLFPISSCWLLYKLTTTEHLGGNGRGNFTRCHRFSFSSTTAVLCCCYYYTTRVCVYCTSEEMTTRSDKWLSCLLRFLSFFLSPPPPKILCRQFDNNFMILFIPSPPSYIQMGCSCLEY